MTREKFSYILLAFGIMISVLPLKTTRSLHGNPAEILKASLEDNTFITPDQVAGFLVSNDSTIRLIDLRSPDEFGRYAIPGSINIPLGEMLKKDPAGYLADKGFRNIFYSNGDLGSNYAVVIAEGLGYSNCCSMKGGLNEWFEKVMNSTFQGQKITARENALFETRIKARKIFTEINTLPDSLKQKYLNSKRFNPRKLDGGCE
jgi:rhodanese-related sulfurtransferase